MPNAIRNPRHRFGTNFVMIKKTPEIKMPVTWNLF